MTESDMMMGTVYEGAGKPPHFKSVPKPTIQQPTDIIVRVRKTTICGTDLQILWGNVPQTKEGRILGHEGIGEVVETGDEVKRHKLGDTVLIKCITACGDCQQCRNNKHAFCTTGGWILGTLIDGMQTEYTRIPHADDSVIAMPLGTEKDSDMEDAIMMACDVLPTCYEIGLRAGAFPKHDGATIAVVGSGPLGLATILCATNDDISPNMRIFAVDLKQSRLDAARKMGATDLILNENGDAVEKIMKATDGRGVDFVVECVGLPAGWDVCQDIVAIGGEISIMGIHGKPVNLKLQKLWEHNISIHTGMVHCHTTPRFMKDVAEKKLDAHQLLSDHFNLSQMEEAYKWFGNPGETGSLKVVIHNDIHNDISPDQE